MEIEHPSYYNAHPSGVECITIIQEYNFNIGNVIKYAWRAGLKNSDPLPDLLKAMEYLKFEIVRLQRAAEREAVDASISKDTDSVQERS